MLPAYAANSLPVISKHLNIFTKLAKPIDGNKLLKGKPLFGHSKTYRGFVVGIAGAALVGLIQYYLFSFEIIQEISLLSYSLKNSLLIGFLLGTGAMLGDLVKSFIKRRLGFKSGQSWIIADQIDYALGALLLGAIIIIPSVFHIIIIIIISPLLSLLANIIAYKTGMKKVWW